MSAASPNDFAKRLLDQCDRIEDAKRKVNATIAAEEKKMDGMNIKMYREQLEQYRRALLTARENSKLKQQKLEIMVDELREENVTLKKTMKLMRDQEQQVSDERASILSDYAKEHERVTKAEAKLASAESIIEKLLAENAKLKKFIVSLKNGPSSSLNLQMKNNQQQTQASNPQNQQVQQAPQTQQQKQQRQAQQMQSPQKKLQFNSPQKQAQGVPARRRVLTRNQGGVQSQQQQTSSDEPRRWGQSARNLFASFRGSGNNQPPASPRTSGTQASPQPKQLLGRREAPNNKRLSGSTSLKEQAALALTEAKDLMKTSKSNSKSSSRSNSNSSLNSSSIKEQATSSALAAITEAKSVMTEAKGFVKSLTAIPDINLGSEVRVKERNAGGPGTRTGSGQTRKVTKNPGPTIVNIPEQPKSENVKKENVISLEDVAAISEVVNSKDETVANDDVANTKEVKLESIDETVEQDDEKKVEDNIATDENVQNADQDEAPVSEEQGESNTVSEMNGVANFTKEEGTGDVQQSPAAEEGEINNVPVSIPYAKEYELFRGDTKPVEPATPPTVGNDVSEEEAEESDNDSVASESNASAQSEVEESDDEHIDEDYQSEEEDDDYDDDHDDEKSVEENGVTDEKEQDVESSNKPVENQVDISTLGDIPYAKEYEVFTGGN